MIAKKTAKKRAKKTVRKKARKKSPRGRKPILEASKGKVDSFITELEKGTPVVHACAIAGIGEPTVYQWLKQSQIDTNHGLKDTIYQEFRERKKKAEAVGISNMCVVIQSSAMKNWQAAAWYLERKDPANFAKVETRREIKVDESREAFTSQYQDRLKKRFEEHKQKAK